MKYVTIPKSKHRPRWRWPIRLVLRRVRWLDIDVAFDETIRDTVCKGQWNKVAGLSTSIHHHRDSVRLAFRYHAMTDKVELGLYRYVNGLRVVSVMRTIPINEMRSITIPIYNRFCWYSLGPYFGGVHRAPHYVNIFFNTRIR